jgi:hypothetical protein
MPTMKTNPGPGRHRLRRPRRVRKAHRTASDGRVTVPTRRLPHGNGVRSLPTVQVVQADVHDDATLRRLVARSDAVINLVAILHGSAGRLRARARGLPRRLAAACQAAGVRRVLHVSALGVGPGAPSNYLRSKTAGERRAAGRGAGPHDLRPSVIFGAQDRFLNLFAQLQAWRRCFRWPAAARASSPCGWKTWPPGGGRAGPARQHRPGDTNAPARRSTPERTGAPGRALAGHERPQIPLPGLAGPAAGHAMEWLPGEPLMSRDNVDSMPCPTSPAASCRAWPRWASPGGAGGRGAAVPGHDDMRGAHGPLARVAGRDAAALASWPGKMEGCTCCNW